MLDASALLAFIHDEPGADAVEDALVKGAAVSAANVAEVLSKLADIGEDPKEVVDTLRRQGILAALEVLPLTIDDAIAIANVRAKTRALGLSLGDRACLGLALRLGVPALTADRSWSGVRLGINIQTIR